VSFSLDLAKFVEKAKENADIVVQKIAIDVLSSVIDRSPVGNPELWKTPRPGYVGGRFRGNWQVGFSVAPTGETGVIDANGSQTKQAGAALLQTFTTGVGSIWLMNNVPYAQRLEYGWSRQAPAGMVRLTVTEFQTFVDRAVQELPQ